MDIKPIKINDYTLEQALEALNKLQKPTEFSFSFKRQKDRDAFEYFYLLKIIKFLQEGDK